MWTVTHHSEVSRGRSVGVGSAVIKAIVPTEVPSDLRRGVPVAKYEVETHSNSHGFVFSMEENSSRYTIVPHGWVDGLLTTVWQEALQKIKSQTCNFCTFPL